MTLLAASARHGDDEQQHEQAENDGRVLNRFAQLGVHKNRRTHDHHETKVGQSAEKAAEKESSATSNLCTQNNVAFVSNSDAFQQRCAARRPLANSPDAPMNSSSSPALHVSSGEMRCSCERINGCHAKLPATIRACNSTSIASVSLLRPAKMNTAAMTRERIQRKIELGDVVAGILRGKYNTETQAKCENPLPNHDFKEFRKHTAHKDEEI
eukprot:TRINITY_DN474_c0_g1_i2.p1 TRINITY_DN474_c0_g1~~TRINITY_DN474_c0_g1_i2.p1  ORF type:complete len:212 (+),score=19.45 TRINITY_DN474_c0_g1_i2:76-711(+)